MCPDCFNTGFIGIQGPPWNPWGWTKIVCTHKNKEKDK